MNSPSELPPLPPPREQVECRGIWNGAPREGSYAVFDEDQMIAYAEAALLAAAPAEKKASISFQQQVSAWAGKCFPATTVHNITERGDRVLEEVLELLQAHGYDRSRVPTLTDYVYSRPAGEPAQEVGGVRVTLSLFCEVAGIDEDAAARAELARIQRPEVMAKIRAKQEAKNALHFDTPLPGNAPAPVAAAATEDAVYAERYRWLREHAAAGSGHPFICVCTLGGFSQWTGDAADRRVDAARDGEGG